MAVCWLWRILDHPTVFALSQRLNPFTVNTYRDLLRAHVYGRGRPTRAVLDIGCGVGAFRASLGSGSYVGIDINARYVAQARAAHGDGFAVMDAAELAFPAGTFDDVVSVATCHHLDGDTAGGMIKEGVRVLRRGGVLHVIDPILPVRSPSRFKRFIFTSDRGRYQRTLDELRRLVTTGAEVVREDVREGRLHDVAYFGAVKRH